MTDGLDRVADIRLGDTGDYEVTMKPDEPKPQPEIVQEESTEAAELEEESTDIQSSETTVPVNRFKGAQRKVSELQKQLAAERSKYEADMKEMKQLFLKTVESQQQTRQSPPAADPFADLDLADILSDSKKGIPFLAAVHNQMTQQHPWTKQMNKLIEEWSPVIEEMRHFTKAQRMSQDHEDFNEYVPQMRELYSEHPEFGDIPMEKVYEILRVGAKLGKAKYAGTQGKAGNGKATDLTTEQIEERARLAGVARGSSPSGSPSRREIKDPFDAVRAALEDI